MKIALMVLLSLATINSFANPEMGSTRDPNGFRFKKGFNLKKSSPDSDVVSLRFEILPGNGDGKEVVWLETTEKFSVRPSCLVQKKTTPEVEKVVVRGEKDDQSSLWQIKLSKKEKLGDSKESKLGPLRFSKASYKETFEIKSNTGSILNVVCLSECSSTGLLGKSKSCERNISGETLKILAKLDIPAPSVVASSEATTGAQVAPVQQQAAGAQ